MKSASPWNLRPLDEWVEPSAPICYGILMPGPDYPGGIPIVKVKDYCSGRLSEQTLLKTTPEIERQYSRSRLKHGDILFSIRGTTGAVACVPGALDGANITQDTARIRVREGMDAEYLLQALQSSFVQTQVKRNTVGQAVKGINIAEVRRLLVPSPPYEEQTEVARILSTWSKAIGQIEALADANECRLRAIAGVLLGERHSTPSVPAPETSSPTTGWPEARLSGISDVLFSTVDKKARESQAPVRLCNYLHVYRNSYITSNLDFMPSTASASEVKRFSLRRGDVLITKDSETPDDIGVPAVVVEDLTRVVCGYHLAIIRPDTTRVNPVFLAKALKHPRVSSQFSRKANGATRFGLSLSAVQDATVWLPPMEQQNQIAALLWNCDRVTQLLRKEAILLKAQKRALAEKLLTGQVRVRTS